MVSNDSCPLNLVEIQNNQTDLFFDRDNSTCVKIMELGDIVLTALTLKNWDREIFRMMAVGKHINCNLITSGTDYPATLCHSTGNSTCGNYLRYCKMIESVTESDLTSCKVECVCNSCTEWSIKFENFPSVTGQINLEICELTIIP